MRPSYLEPLSRQLLSWPSATKEKGPEEGEGGDENEAASGAQAHIPCAPFATSLSFVLSLFVPLAHLRAILVVSSLFSLSPSFLPGK